MKNRVPFGRIVNTSPDLVIAVDSSTTASKAVIWDRHGQAIAEKDTEPARRLPVVLVNLW